MSERDETLDEIMRAAGKHPHSGVSNLIRLVQAERSQKNIVLLLIELAEHAEYSADFGISLRYYLDLFDRLGIAEEIVLNEAGLLLLSSSKVYARRVDYIHELVQHQILTLSKSDRDSANANENGGKERTTAEKPNRRRKRLVETSFDPFEINLEPKIFRKLALERRFAVSPAAAAAAAAAAKRLTTPKAYETEQYIHPALYAQSSIVDLENEDDIDSKRNYRLFSCHVEHRYNTLRSDLDFPMHFMVKDYMDKENERIQDEPEIKARVWPPLSEEYIEKYVCLENQVLEAELGPLRKRLRSDMQAPLEETAVQDTTANSLLTELNVICTPENSLQSLDASEMEDDLALESSMQVGNTSALNASAPNDSGMGDSLMEASSRSLVVGADGNGTLPTRRNDSALGASIGELEDTQIEIHEDAEDKEEAATMPSPLADVIKIDVDVAESLKGTTDPAVEKVELEDEGVIDLSTILVYLPHMKDGQEVRFTELNAMQQRMLTPSCVATDVFPCMENKNDIVLIVDDDVRALNGLANIDSFQRPHALVPPLSGPRVAQTLERNILQLPLRLFKRKKIFDPKGTIDEYLKAKNLKRTRTEEMRDRREFKMLKLPTQGASDGVIEEERPNSEPRPWRFATALRNRTFSVDSNSDFSGFESKSDDEEFSGFIESPTTDVAAEDGEEARNEVLLSPRTENSAEMVIVKDEWMTEHAAVVETPPVTDIAFNGLATSVEAKEELLNEVGDADLIGAINATMPTNMAMESIVIDSEDATDESDVVGAEVVPENADDANAANPDQDERQDGDDVIADRELRDELALSGTKTKIQEWHERLQPILAKARERHHFDVFQIGSEIIDDIQTQGHITHNSDNCAPGPSAAADIVFADVMRNREKSYVSRYFLSTLLLANQGNIEINVRNQNCEVPSAWSDIQLKLLSTQRHTVAIEDNIGMIVPSEPAAANQFKTPTAPRKPQGSRREISQALSQTVPVRVNLNAVTPLKQMQKITREEDYDSGIYSSEELIS